MFKILRKDDVERLSKELRYLDERADCLRRMCTSFRASRRHRHSQICHGLRDSHTAKLSCESMLKQEGALSELDALIDGWTSTLENVENCRSRIRQQLLEHIAATASMPLAGHIAKTARRKYLGRAVFAEADSSATSNSTAIEEHPICTYDGIHHLPADTKRLHLSTGTVILEINLGYEVPGGGEAVFIDETVHPNISSSPNVILMNKRPRQRQSGVLHLR
ncbi:hypothetical protein JX266_013780 [Neoarthrinium moseri]|nr:hypothetical protein JX266_013780 [Neoarthrinium moseri]